MNRWTSLQYSFGFGKTKTCFCHNIQVHSIYIYIYILEIKEVKDSMGERAYSYPVVLSLYGKGPLRVQG